MDYTIIGGAVNTASRLETLAEPGQILITYETFAHVKDKFHCEKKGEAKVKGIAYPVDTYLVNDSDENLSQLRNRFLEEHHGMKVDLNFDAMDSDDQHNTAEVLRCALKWLEDHKDCRLIKSKKPSN